ncbi:LOW QUALITY PROTEIN: hypothetical protein HZS_6948 [Henneguya salminicola]|nr:LOW QUALITY PROTEIN: hypothetical protein HZS_6948 [Henneguya salminicola]
MLFNLAIAPLTVWLSKLIKFSISEDTKFPLNHILYVDDLKIFSRCNPMNFINPFKKRASSLGLIFNSYKCAILPMKKSFSRSDLPYTIITESSLPYNYLEKKIHEPKFIPRNYSKIDPSLH